MLNFKQLSIYSHNGQYISSFTSMALLSFFICVYSEFDDRNLFQTSWDKSNKRLRKL